MNKSIILLALLLLGIAPIYGGLTLVPTGLSPGDSYHLVFVTSASTTALSTDIDDYNAIVQSAADNSVLASLGATWTAIASTPSVDARDNVGGVGLDLSNSIFTVQDSLVATSEADLFNGSILAPINADELDNTSISAFVWTGSQSGANGLGESGRQLGSTSGNSLIVGSTDFSDDRWMFAGSIFGNSQARLYGISSVLTVPVVPEPSSYLLFGIGLFSLSFYRRTKKSS